MSKDLVVTDDGWIEVLDVTSMISERMKGPFVVPRPFEKHKPQPWSVDFVSRGLAGEKKYITVQQGCLFRGTHLIECSDSVGGRGTRIEQLLAGRRVQGLPNLPQPILTADFVSMLGHSKQQWKIDTVDRALSMSLSVHFIEDCEFKMVIGGIAVV